jgi:1-acyl-sn-glycerol-3-phosphate acyltransferase
MWYAIAKRICIAFFKLFFRIKIENADLVPKEGSVLICANHISNFDPISVGVAVPRPVHFMAKVELFRVPILRGLVRSLHAFPVKRGAGDVQAIKQSMQILKNQEALVMFPEGTRHTTGELGKLHSGAALLAHKTHSPIVPVAIIGPYRIFGRLKVVFGEPIDPASFASDRKKNEAIEAITEELRARIARLLDEHR